MDPTVLSAAADVAVAASEVTDEWQKLRNGILTRLFGPMADVLGKHWASELANRLGNVRRVAELADVRTRGTEGSIPARVADSVFQTAQFAETEFVTEYLSGIMASSRTPGGTDDRGISWTSLIGQMSTDQIRLHYILYSAGRPVIAKHAAEQTDSAMCAVRMFLSFDDIDALMGWDGDVRRFREAAYGLQRQVLLQTISHGTGPFLSKSYDGAHFPARGGLFYRARLAGFGLYLWGQGEGGESATRLLDAEFSLTPVGFDLPSVPEATWMEEIVGA